jgi:hypothetical protein
MTCKFIAGQDKGAMMEKNGHVKGCPHRNPPFKILRTLFILWPCKISAQLAGDQSLLLPRLTWVIKQASDPKLPLGLLSVWSLVASFAPELNNFVKDHARSNAD